MIGHDHQVPATRLRRIGPRIGGAREERREIAGSATFSYRPITSSSPPLVNFAHCRNLIYRAAVPWFSEQDAP
jgi:hypothetical protein